MGVIGLPIQVCYFAIFYLALRTGESFSVWRPLLLVVSLWLYLAYIVLVNDFSDRGADASAGKATVSRGHALSRSQVAWVLVAIVAANAMVVLLIGGSVAFGAAWLAAYLLGTLYSVPPASLKRRGVLGFVSDSLIEKPLPVIIVFAFFQYYGFEILLFPIVGEFLDSVFKHQERDYDSDVATGMRTFAVSIGRQLSTRVVDSVLHPLDAFLVLTAFLTATFQIPRLSLTLTVLLVLLVLGAVGAFLLVRGSLFKSKEIGWVDPPYVTYFNAWFIAALVTCLGAAAALADITYAPLFALFLLSLVPYLRYYLRLGKLVLGRGARRAAQGHDAPLS